MATSAAVISDVAARGVAAPGALWAVVAASEGRQKWRLGGWGRHAPAQGGRGCVEVGGHTLHSIRLRAGHSAGLGLLSRAALQLELAGQAGSLAVERGDAGGERTSLRLEPGFQVRSAGSFGFELRPQLGVCGALTVELLVERSSGDRLGLAGRLRVVQLRAGSLKLSSSFSQRRVSFGFGGARGVGLEAAALERVPGVGRRLACRGEGDRRLLSLGLERGRLGRALAALGLELLAQRCDGRGLVDGAQGLDARDASAAIGPALAPRPRPGALGGRAGTAGRSPRPPDDRRGRSVGAAGGRRVGAGGGRVVEGANGRVGGGGFGGGRRGGR